MKRIAVALAICAAAYGLACAGVYTAMRQPPERFGAIMAKMPKPVVMALPFRPLWMRARAGDLQVGSAAPDFALPALHDGGVVRLADATRHRPVVLVFGSYT